MAKKPTARRPTPPAETEGYSPAQTLMAQRRRGQPLVGEQTVFVDKYNGNFLTGIVIRPHWASHHDSPIWEAELTGGQLADGSEIEVEKEGPILSFDHSEWKAGIARWEESNV